MIRKDCAEIEELEAQLRPGETPENDVISTKMLQLLDEIGLEKITDDMKKSTFIPLPKKPKTVNCTDDFRAISLMSHVTKILIKIILYRNSASIDLRNRQK